MSTQWGEGVRSKVDRCGHGEATVDVHKLHYSFVTAYSSLTGPVTPFYGIMKLVLHSNFDICTFHLFTFTTLKDWLLWAENRNRSIFKMYWCRMTGTLCWSVTIWSGRPRGRRGLAEVDMGGVEKMPEFCRYVLWIARFFSVPPALWLKVHGPGKLCNFHRLNCLFRW